MDASARKTGNERRNANNQLVQRLYDSSADAPGSVFPRYENDGPAV
jgi:hypothetical protein